MRELREFTMARVGLGRAGDALPLREVLKLRAAHSAARDAVHETMDLAGMGLECRRRGWEYLTLHSAAADRIEYLRRPDRGRRLDDRAKSLLATHSAHFDAAIILGDGLSPLAVHRHAIAVLELLLPKLEGWRLAPLAIVEQARVAVGDEIGAALNAALALVLIGERPGLTSPDSLGAYLTWNPRPGKTDAERNCISNIRPEGLSYEDAAGRLFALMTESRTRQLSGVTLKEGDASLTK
jgi:ethanolamine ammonia-lyase small subunit